MLSLFYKRSVTYLKKPTVLTFSGVVAEESSLVKEKEIEGILAVEV